MSGGDLDYVFLRVRQAADDIDQLSNKDLHRRFAQHLRKVAVALKDLEWVMGDDDRPGSEEKSINDVLGDNQCILGMTLD